MAASDDTWDRKARGETETERLDRNWSMLVQELRVVQTGVQFLIGSLLILPFQVGFGTLSHPLRLLYLATVAAASGFLPGLRVLSRNSPSTPCSAKRCCHRHTAGRLASVRRATASTGKGSADKRTIRAR